MSRYRSYWDGTGTHQAEFKRLRTALVPVGGAAETPHGELLRAVARLYHHARANGLRHIEDLWDAWRIVDAHRSALAAAIGPQGSWVMAVVERAVGDRYLHATRGEGIAPVKVPVDAFERLVDGCVVVVGTLSGGGTPPEPKGLAGIDGTVDHEYSAVGDRAIAYVRHAAQPNTVLSRAG